MSPEVTYYCTNKCISSIFFNVLVHGGISKGRLLLRKFLKQKTLNEFVSVVLPVL